MEGWLEHENGVQALKTWLTVQEEKLKKRQRIEDVASVQSALKDCQVGPHSRKNLFVWFCFCSLNNEPKINKVVFTGVGRISEGKREGSRESGGTRKCSHPG